MAAVGHQGHESSHPRTGTFEGADERGRVAFEYVEPRGWEISGRPSEAAVETLRENARRAGVGLTFHPELVSGFIRR